MVGSHRSRRRRWTHGDRHRRRSLQPVRGAGSWDFTVRGHPESGQIRISGMPPASSASLILDDASISSVTADGVASLDVYSAGVRAFPVEGYFVLEESTGPFYKSPRLTLWGGDEFRYDGTNSYPNAGVDSNVHDRLSGALEFQTGRAASPAIRQESYLKWSSDGLVEARKTFDGTAWRVESRTHSPEGLLETAVDPLGRITGFGYALAYGRARLTRITEPLARETRFTYDPSTALLLSERDPGGYRTIYEHDAIGRVTSQSRFDLPELSERLHFDMETTVEYDAARFEDLTGTAPSYGIATGTLDTEGRRGRARAFVAANGDQLQSFESPASVGTLSFWAKPTPAASDGMVPFGANRRGHVFRHRLIEREMAPRHQRRRQPFSSHFQHPPSTRTNGPTSRRPGTKTRTPSACSSTASPRPPQAQSRTTPQP